MRIRVRLPVLVVLGITSAACGQNEELNTAWMESTLKIQGAVQESAQTTSAPSLDVPDLTTHPGKRRAVGSYILQPLRVMARDQKTIWSFPARVWRGDDWKPALAVLATTVALVALDPEDTPYFRRTTVFHGLNDGLSGRNTVLGESLFPAVFCAAGLLRKDMYACKTALLASESTADAEIVGMVMKNASRRILPREIPPNGDFTHTWFKSHAGVISGNQAFPSGHTIAAFSVATVFADRYHHRWVPWAAYSLAGFVGFSRITLQQHFPSDVFLGGVLGFAISHYVVSRRPFARP
jgi:membrane-associated phospholipid phosphatase